MSINWIQLMNDVSDCKDMAAVTKLANKCGIKDVHLLVLRAIRTYAYNRDYRERRNQSIGALKARVAELEAKVTE